MINPGMFGSTYSGGTPYGAGEAASASSAAHAAKRDVKHIEDRFERLSLVCMAMWSLLQDKTNLTEEDLLDRVRTIDLMDGVEDRKATKTVAKCSACNRTMHPRHAHCLYCGATKLIQSAFDAI